MKEFIYYFKQNKGALIGFWIIVFLCIVALLAPVLSPHDPILLDVASLKLKPFSPHHLLGTDDVGRDLLSRLIYGARVSLGIGFLCVLISVTVGSFLGLIAGYMGGFVDRQIMRLVDLMMALPSILLAIVVVAILGPSLINTVIAVSIVSLPSFIRLVRASVLEEKEKQYVLAVKSFGASHFRILFLNIFPNCLAPLIVQGSLNFSNAILDAAALGFLGLGAQPPIPEWGTMLADARPFIESAPWLVTFPGVCILVSVLAFNLLGDGLRDALDPKLKK